MLDKLSSVVHSHHAVVSFIHKEGQSTRDIQPATVTSRVSESLCIMLRFVFALFVVCAVCSVATGLRVGSDGGMQLTLDDGVYGSGDQVPFEVQLPLANTTTTSVVFQLQYIDLSSVECDVCTSSNVSSNVVSLELSDGSTQVITLTGTLTVRSTTRTSTVALTGSVHVAGLPATQVAAPNLVVIQRVQPAAVTAVKDFCDVMVLSTTFETTASLLTDAAAKAAASANVSDACPATVWGVLNVLSKSVCDGSCATDVPTLLEAIDAFNYTALALDCSAAAINLASSAVTTLQSFITNDISPFAQTAVDESVCGDGVCDLDFETCSCQDCACSMVDTSWDGGLAVAGRFFASVNVGTISMTWQPMQPLPIDRVLSFEVSVLQDTSFAIDQLFNTFLVHPVDTAPEGSCFTGFSFHSRLVDGVGSPLALSDDVTYSMDVSHLTLGFVGKRSFSVSYFNVTLQQWIKVEDQLYDLETRTLRMNSSLAGQFAVFSVPFALSVESFTPAQETGALAFSNDVADLLDTLLADLDSSLEVGGPPIVIASEGITIQATRVNASSLNNLKATAGNASFPEVALPGNLTSEIDNLGSDVSVMLSVFAGAQTNSSNTSTADIVDFTLRSDGSNLHVANLSTPIDIKMRRGPQMLNESTCTYWNPNKERENCTATDADNCLGDWDTEGVELIEELSTDEYLVCRTTHLSTFSVSFVIAKPVVTLDNFSFQQSKFIYTVFFTFYGFVLLTYLYSYLERRAYDRRQAMIDAGLIWDTEAPPNQDQLEIEWLEMPFWKGYFARLWHEFKNKHNWLAVVWFNGVRVYPKRFIKVTALVATTSLAFGMMAIFNYTAQQYPDERVNVLAIHGKNKTVYIPLEGIYSFLMTFPVLITLSICIAKYSVFMDTLRKVAPERYRNHAAANNNPAVKGKYFLSGEEDDDDELIDDHRHRLSSIDEPSIMMTTHFPDLASSTSCDSGTGSANASGNALVTPGSTPAAEIEVELPRGFNPEFEAANGKALSELAVTNAKDDLVVSEVGKVVTVSKPVQKKEDTTMTEEEILALDAKMRRFRGFTFGLAVFMMLSGLILALVFMGSTEEAMQRRYLRAVAGFMIMSAVITAPIVLIVTSLRRHYVQRKRKQQMTEEEWKNHVVRMTVMATAIMMTQAMIYTEIGRAIKSSLDFNII
eukprot:m.214203 g.214203  ORF g.214203 m.214203 type:complete len:1170 (+) comp15099_c1_seq4:126-3635(+)